MTTLIELADQQLVKLGKASFIPDPLLGSYSLLASVLASAPKRHGRLIEAAIVDALQQNHNYRVWSDRRYIVPAAVDHLVQSQTPDEITLSHLPYGAPGRQLQIDLFAYSVPRRRLGAYEIKRGNGYHDAGKLRSLRRDVFAVQATLASYGAQRGLAVDEAISRVVYYYGRRQLPEPWSLTGADLDEHFECPVRCRVDDITDYFSARLHEVIDQGLHVLRPETRQLALEGIL